MASVTTPLKQSMTSLLKARCRSILLNLVTPLVRRLGKHLETDTATANRNKLLNIGAEYLSNGHIKFENIQFHPSYPTFDNILVENLYFENYKFPLNGSWIVFDIGANAGASCLWFASHENVDKVYAFEPVKPTYNMLLKNVALNADFQHKIETFQIGLGARRASLEIPFHPDHVMSVSSTGTFDSCFEPESIEKIQVEPADEILGALLKRHNESRKFLKIDCEGAEYEILPILAKAGLLNNVDVIIVEWHGGDFQDLVSILEEAGFFCFIEWHRRDKWKIGIIKAVKQLNKLNAHK